MKCVLLSEESTASILFRKVLFVTQDCCSHTLYLFLLIAVRFLKLLHKLFSQLTLPLQFTNRILMIIVLFLNLSHLVLFLLQLLDSQLQLFIMLVLSDVHRPEFFPCPRHLRICRYQHLQNNFVQDQLVVADTEHFPLSGVDRLFVMDDDSIDGHD